MRIEEETFKIYERMKRMFDIEKKRDNGAKMGEPEVTIMYIVPNQDYVESDPRWKCTIFSYMVEIKDSEGFGKRRYSYYAYSLKELVKIIKKVLDEAETQYDLENGTIIKRFGDE